MILTMFLLSQYLQQFNLHKVDSQLDQITKPFLEYLQKSSITPFEKQTKRKRASESTIKAPNIDLKYLLRTLNDFKGDNELSLSLFGRLSMVEKLDHWLNNSKVGVPRK